MARIGRGQPAPIYLPRPHFGAGTTTISIGQPTETDLAQTVAHYKIVHIGQATETDLSQATAHYKIVHTGQATETDLAQSVTHYKVGELTQPVETDLAQSVTPARIHSIGQSTESDSAQTVKPAHSVTIGQPTETDLAQAVAHYKIVHVGQATETDTAQTVAPFVATPLYPTDDFNRADGSLGSNWTTYTAFESPYGDPSIVSNQAVGVAGEHSGAMWNAHRLDDDQTSIVSLGAALTSGQFIGATVRGSDDGSQMYAALLFKTGGNTAIYLYKSIASSFSLLATSANIGDQPPGHELRLEVIGDNLNAYFDGVSMVTATDSDLTSGNPGFMSYDAAIVDDFSAHSIRNFGNNSTSGAVDVGADGLDNIVGTTFTLPEDAGIIRLEGYYPGHVSKSRGVIYPKNPSSGDADGESPAGATVEVTSATISWVEYPVSLPNVIPIDLDAGDYVLGMWFGDTSSHLYGDSSTGVGSFSSTATYASTGSPQDPFVNALTYTENWCIYAVYWPAVEVLSSAGQTVTIGQPEEIDLAQAVTHYKIVHVGQATESDSAQAITHYKVVELTQPTETDSAQTVTHYKVVEIGQATESDLAQPITTQGVHAIGQSTETDLAQPIAHYKILHLGQAQETDSANATRAEHSVTIGQPLETDSSQAVTHYKVVRIGQATETDTSQPTTHRRIYTIGQANESDEAQAITTSAVHVIGQPLETDLSQPVAHYKIVHIGQAVETDSAQSVRPAKAHPINQCTETDAAQPITHARRVTIGQATESDLAQHVGHYKIVHVTQANETDTCQHITVRTSGEIHVTFEVSFGSSQWKARIGESQWDTDMPPNQWKARI